MGQFLEFTPFLMRQFLESTPFYLDNFWILLLFDGTIFGLYPFLMGHFVVLPFLNLTIVVLFLQFDPFLI